MTPQNGKYNKKPQRPNDNNKLKGNSGLDHDKDKREQSWRRKGPCCQGATTEAMRERAYDRNYERYLNDRNQHARDCTAMTQIDWPLTRPVYSKETDGSSPSRICFVYNEEIYSRQLF
jgi:hypothetical protein